MVAIYLFSLLLVIAVVGDGGAGSSSNRFLSLR